MNNMEFKLSYFSGVWQPGFRIINAAIPVLAYDHATLILEVSGVGEV
jgi:hypothetical protein